MTQQSKSTRNPFFFSRAGMKTISSFAAVPAVADDLFSTVPAKRNARVSPWMCFYHQSAHFVCE
ncbi:MAG: hypothetical protein ACR2QT_02100 [Woeseiaceae bacterium]